MNSSNTSQKQTKMSLDEARSVPWPMQELKGQAIGPLFDKGLLSLKDLGFAVQRAYERRVREAARTILLHALSQEPLEPENSPGPLNVITSKHRSFAERRQLQISLIEGSVFGFILALSLYLLGLAITYSHHASHKNSTVALSSTTGIISLVIVVIIFAVLMVVAAYVPGKVLDFLIFNRFEKQLQLHRQGQLGEERVLNMMYGVLDGKWWLFRNLELPGRRLGDLDFVLVGPPGVWSFEVKAYSGEYRNVGEQWQKRYGSRWFSLPKSPTRQARRNAAELHQLLTTHQINQWITPVIIWANPESTVLLDNQSTDVWTLEQIPDHLQNLNSGQPMPEAQIQGIVEVLKEIYTSHGNKLRFPDDSEI